MVETFLTIKQLCERLPLRTRRITKLVAAGMFPQPVWLSNRRKVWKLSEIEAWAAAATTERPPAPPRRVARVCDAAIGEGK